jgi:hypothetical protein
MSLDGRIPPTSDDDHEQWMDTFSTVADEEIDALLRGKSALPVAPELTTVVHELRSDAVRHGAPPMSAALRAQIARPTPTAVSTLRRRRLIASGLGGLLLGGATMGVAAAQDVLPVPIQDATASVAGVLGLDLPRSTDRDAPGSDGTADDGTSGSGRSTDTTTAANEPSGDGSTGTTPEDVSTAGPPDSTPGGALPADPGTPGDEEPATPATPATGDGQGAVDDVTDQGSGNAQGSGRGNGNSASETGQATGRGTAQP